MWPARKILLIAIGAASIVAALVAPTAAAGGHPDYVTTDWSTPTNGVMVALRHPDVASSRTFSELEVEIVLASASTNRIRVWLPTERELLQVELIKSNAKLVTKTKRGKKLNLPLTRTSGVALDRQGFRTILVEKGIEASAASFRLSDFFEDPGEGSYTLRVQMRTFVDLGNHLPTTFSVPQIKVNILK